MGGIYYEIQHTNNGEYGIRYIYICMNEGRIYIWSDIEHEITLLQHLHSSFVYKSID